MNQAKPAKEPGALPPRRWPLLPATVLALSATSFFTDVASEMVFPLLPLLTANWAGGMVWWGVVEGLADAVASVTKLYSGRWAEKSRSKKPWVLWGYGMAAVVKPLTALAFSSWHLLLIRVVDRLGKGIRSTPRDVLISNSVPSHLSGQAFGFHRGMDHLGAVVGPLLAALLLSCGVSLTGVLALTAIPGLLSVWSVLLLRESAPSRAGGAPAATPSRAESPARLTSFLRIIVLFALGNSSDAFLLLRAQSLGVSSAHLPLLWALFHVVKSVSAVVFGKQSDARSRVGLIGAGWLLYSTCYIGFALASQPWQLWTLFVAYGLYYGLTEPAEKALVKSLAAGTSQGTAFGWYNFAVGISAIPASLLTAFLWRNAGPSVALLVGAAVSALALLALIVWSQVGSKTTPP
jgi:MFS family permease